MNFNIQGLPPPWARDSGRLRLIGEELARRRAMERAPTLVGLQEAFRKSVSQLVDAADYQAFVTGPPRHRSLMNSGLLTLSDLRPTLSENRWYSTCGSWDCSGAKGVQHLRLILADGSKVDFYNTHLQSDPYNNPFFSVREAVQVRHRQLQQLLEFVHQTRSRGAALLLVGDFNFTAQETWNYELIKTSLGVANALEFCLRNKNCDGDATQGDLKTAIDHQFFAPSQSAGGLRIHPVRFERSFRPEEHSGRVLSDHLSVEVLYELSH